MRNLLLKISVAIFTFTIGVTLAAYWFFDAKPLLHGSQFNKSLIEEPTPVNNLSETSESFLKGKSVAERDISQGKLKVVTLGTEMLRGKIYRETLVYGYEIEVNSLGCFISDKDREFAAGYNQMAEVVIEQLYGKGVLKNVARYAEEQEKLFFKYLEENKEALEKKYPGKK